MEDTSIGFYQRKNLTTKTFESFSEYFDYLGGDVYENACYFQYKFENDTLKKFNLDVERLTSRKSFVTETIDDNFQEISMEEIAYYNNIENTSKTIIKYWLEKFNACDTYEQFKTVCKSYEESSELKSIFLEFYIFQYALNNSSSKNRFDIIMKYMSKDYQYGSNTIMGLCLIYDPEEVLNNYDYSQFSDRTNKMRKKEVKEFVEELKQQDFEKEIRNYFNKTTNLYTSEIKIYRYENNQGIKKLNKCYYVNVYRVFETFDDFINYRKGDLTNCDLSKAIDLNVDLSKYKIDSKTKLPPQKNTNLKYIVRKKYNKAGSSGKFYVEQIWNDEYGKCLKKQSYKFSYFFDFVAFLKGDLSGADLLFCKGMKNLSDINGINLSDAKMTSDVCEKLGIVYTKFNYDENLIGEFSLVEEGEKQTAVVLQTSRDKVDNKYSLTNKNSKICYISDLHLMHRIKNAGCKSKEDIIYTIQKIVDKFARENSDVILIGGDVSSEFALFEIFVKLLRNSVERTYGNFKLSRLKPKFVFILGNHELWGFPNLSVEKIVEKYRSVLHENGMYLLQNDLFYENESDDFGIIPYDELMNLDKKIISDKLRSTRIAILGGLGFSGYNEVFNAKNGIYRLTVDRNTEINESKKFETLYKKLIDVLPSKNTIILTHTPKSDWSVDNNYYDNFVYVSGHTHKNVFFDDGVERIYADNQIGYRCENIQLKSFLMETSYEMSSID